MPAVVKVSEQLPVAGLVAVRLETTQLTVPSLTVTVPVGAPPPGGTTETETPTVTACPTTDGSGESLVIAVVVAA